MFARAASTLVRQVPRMGARAYSDAPMAFTFASQNQVSFWCTPTFFFSYAVTGNL